MNGYRCIVCGARHDELPTCFIAPEPLNVGVLLDEERRTRLVQSSDQCVLDGEHFFILGNLDVPIIGRDEPFRWSVWTTLSEKNFLRASELWETSGRESEPPYFGWLSNEIPGYSTTINLKTLVHTQPVGIRPFIEIMEQEHALYEDQREGISMERAWGLIHAALHSGTDIHGP